MRIYILTILIFISNFSISQELISINILSIDSQERNKKNILLFKQINDFKETYYLKARNYKSKDFSSCQWETQMNANDFIYFSNALRKLKSDTSFETNSFKLRSIRNKVYFYFNNTRCKGGHKTHYFQQKCNRLLSFVLDKQNFDILNSAIYKSIDNNYVKK